MVYQNSQLFSQFVIIGKDGSPVTIASKVL